jgi:hypothetical protein
LIANHPKVPATTNTASQPATDPSSKVTDAQAMATQVAEVLLSSVK